MLEMGIVILVACICGWLSMRENAGNDRLRAEAAKSQALAEQQAKCFKPDDERGRQR